MRIIKGLGVLVLALIVLALVGLALMIRPDIPYAKLERKYGAPGDSYMATPQGVVVHYRDQGPRGAPVLVLVHGFAASLIDWDDWADRLDNRYRVIRLDLPGHGLTQAPVGYHAGMDGYADLVDGVTRQLGAQRFVLAGNSMGGGVALDFALRHPERLDGLVLVDAAGWPSRSAPKGEPAVFKLLENPVARGLLRYLDAKPLIAQGLRAAFLDKRLVTTAVVDRYSDLARAPGHRSVLMSLQQRGLNPMTTADFARIAVPTLVMHGEQDRLIPFADGQGFARAIPGATLIAYPGVGHVPMEQIPARSAADLDQWIRAKVYRGAKASPG
jgi:pimeloyl-ACP methyl ester carboxylesterase